MTRHTKSSCPRCSKKLDASTSVSGEKSPGTDDVTVCIYCQAVLQYNEDLSVRLASAEAVAECTLEISQIQNAIRKHHKTIDGIFDIANEKAAAESEEEGSQ